MSINIRRPELITTDEEIEQYIILVEESRRLNKSGKDGSLVVRLPKFYCDLMNFNSLDRVKIYIEKIE